MSNGGSHRWADLPKELLENIGKGLDSRIDVYRFRAVCTSWRSSVPPSYRQSPRVLIKLPVPIRADAFLSTVIICRIELAAAAADADAHNENKRSSSLSAFGAKAWLTKVEESMKGEMQLLIPLSNHQINSPGTFPKLLNLLNFRLVELTKAYTLKLTRGISVFGISKVVMFPDPARSVDVDMKEYGLLAICHEGKLCYWGYGDEQWRILDEPNFHYDDIIVYKGQFYVVDRWGTVSWIDSSLNVIQYAPPLYGCGNQKHLVESCGDLYVVDRYLDGERRVWLEYQYENVNHHDMNDDFYHFLRNYPRCRAKTVDVKVYKLDEEWATWVDVRSLGDRIFVLGNDCCFSVSAKDFPGCEGDAIYYIDPDDEDLHGELNGYYTHVFRVGARTTAKVAFSPNSFHIFWPPPDWLSSTPCILGKPTG